MTGVIPDIIWIPIAGAILGFFFGAVVLICKKALEQS